MRKKKVKEVKVESTSPIGYSGKVEVKILDGKKVLSSRTIKNSGRLPLFKFFAYCLTGKYSLAEDQRPNYIQLFNSTAIDTEANLFAADWTQKTYPVPLSTSPTVDHTADSAKGILKFTIPFSLITDKSNINLLVLKSNATLDAAKDVCAYVTISEAGGLIPSQLIDKEKYTLFIKWSLSIQDQDVVKVN